MSLDLYRELARLRMMALLSSGIDGREHTTLVAVETRLRTLEAENARLKLEATVVIQDRESAEAHPATIEHWRSCNRCSAGASCGGPCCGGDS